jgi:hypothetical protein
MYLTLFLLHTSDASGSQYIRYSLFQPSRPHPELVDNVFGWRESTGHCTFSVNWSSTEWISFTPYRIYTPPPPAAQTSHRHAAWRKNRRRLLNRASSVPEGSFNAFRKHTVIFKQIYHAMVWVIIMSSKCSVHRLRNSVPLVVSVSHA